MYCIYCASHYSILFRCAPATVHNILLVNLYLDYRYVRQNLNCNCSLILNFHSCIDVCIWFFNLPFLASNDLNTTQNNILVFLRLTWETWFVQKIQFSREATKSSKWKQVKTECWGGSRRLLKIQRRHIFRRFLWGRNLNAPASHQTSVSLTWYSTTLLWYPQHFNDTHKTHWARLYYQRPYSTFIQFEVEADFETDVCLLDICLTWCMPVGYMYWIGLILIEPKQKFWMEIELTIETLQRP